MSFPRYPRYKDSGVEWLGEVPEGWGAEPFKRHIIRNDGGVWGADPTGEKDTIVLRSTEQTAEGEWRLDDPATRQLSDAEIASALLIEGDLLVTKSSGSSLHIGKTTLVTPEIEGLHCCYSNFMQRIRTGRSLLPKLAWYLMNSSLSRLQLDLLSNSSTGLANLNGTMLAQLVLPIPPVDEQLALVTFLDRETANLDALVAEQQHLIQLLKEKRQAVISHAVTRGLDPDAPMKPSGVEWLGEVPAHWRMVPIKHLGGLRGGAGFPHDEQGIDGAELSFHKVGALSQAGEDGVLPPSPNSVTRETAARLRAFIFPPGTFVFAKVGAALLLGRIRLLDESACIDNNMMGLVIEQGDHELAYWRYALSLIRFDLLANPGAVPSLNEGQVGNTRLPYPPPNEQAAIAAFLERETRKMASLLAEAERAIALLQERRTALISAAVTGKIDVRGLAESW